MPGYHNRSNFIDCRKIGGLNAFGEHRPMPGVCRGVVGESFMVGSNRAGEFLGTGYGALGSTSPVSGFVYPLRCGDVNEEGSLVAYLALVRLRDRRRKTPPRGAGLSPEYPRLREIA